MVGFVGSLSKGLGPGRRGIQTKMSASPVVLCPGQGAQSVGMGKAWKEKSKAAQKIFDRADAVLGDRLGSKLSDIIMNGPKVMLYPTVAGL